MQGGESHRISQGDVFIMPPDTMHWYKDVATPFRYIEVPSRNFVPQQSGLSTVRIRTLAGFNRSMRERSFRANRWPQVFATNSLPRYLSSLEIVAWDGRDQASRVRARYSPASRLWIDSTASRLYN